tara:strand:+ start:141 stop:500 length:360 start_codon:yes stop_codon:yes gene_type:complete
MSEELNRILSNPDHVIMSDSLKEILDLESENNEKITTETCTVSCGDINISGQIKKISWSELDSFLKVCFSCDQSIFTDFLKMKGKEVSILVFGFRYSGKVLSMFLDRSLSTEVELTIQS